VPCLASTMFAARCTALTCQWTARQNLNTVSRSWTKSTHNANKRRRENTERRRRENSTQQQKKNAATAWEREKQCVLLEEECRQAAGSRQEGEQKINTQIIIMLVMTSLKLHMKHKIITLLSTTISHQPPASS
jgi:hypothetical protein